MTKYTHNEQVVSAFFQGKQSGTNYQQSLSFRNGKLYSYNSVLAYWYGDVLFINSDIAYYSITSAKHNSLLRKFTNPYEILYVLGNTPQQILTNAYNDITMAIGYYERARQNKLYRLNSLVEYHRTFKRLSTLLKVDKRTKAYRAMKPLTEVFFAHKILHLMEQ